MKLVQGKTMKRMVACAALVLLSGQQASAQRCDAKGVFVQVLGSGGPLVGDSRASSSYLVWVDGRARVLVDVGGGSFLRFGQAGARLDDLVFAGITHLHPDHVSDLPALLWFSDAVRKERLAIAGPSGNAAAPSLAIFLRRLFDTTVGAFPMLAGTVGESGRGVPLDVGVVDVNKREPSVVFDRQGLTVTAVGVPHGAVPALAYRIQTKGASIVFSGDQTGTESRFAELAKGATVLVMHLAVAAGDTNPAHASPATIGKVARDAHVGRLIVSHLGPGVAPGSSMMQPELDLQPALAEIRNFYKGALTVGMDLLCVPVDPASSGSR